MSSWGRADLFRLPGIVRHHEKGIVIMTEITGKTALVTGGNRGIGRALVDEALRRGARRVYASTRGPWAHPDERVTPLAFDVTDQAAIRAASEAVESLDILVNNAGIALYDDLTDRSAIERQLAVNLFGPYEVIQAFLPQLTESPGGHRQQPVAERPRAAADYPGVLRLEGGRLQPHPVAARPARGAGHPGPGRVSRPRALKGQPRALKGQHCHD